MACFSQTNGTSCNSLNGNGLRGKPLAGVLNTKNADGDARMPTAKYGMGCIGCAAARFENLEAGAKVHGIDVDEMVDAMNEILEKNN